MGGRQGIEDSVAAAAAADAPAPPRRPLLPLPQGLDAAITLSNNLLLADQLRLQVSATRCWACMLTHVHADGCPPAPRPCLPASMT
jgi:hypothetical protein